MPADPDDKGSALRLVAAVQAAAGDMEGARQTADSIAARQPQAYAFCDFVEARIKAGDTAGAKELVQLAKKSCRRRDRQNRATKDAPRRGRRHGRHRRSGRSAEDRRRHRSAFREGDGARMVVTAQARAGDIAGAKHGADAIIDDYAKGLALGDVAGAQAKAGQIKEAKETAAAIENPDPKQAAYRQIAAVQLKAGDKTGAKESLDQAFATTEDVHNPGSKAWAYRCIAIGQARAGDVPAALKTAAGIEQAYARALAYRGCRDTGQGRRCRRHKETLALAKKSAEAIENSGEKSAYRDIAATCVRAGDAPRRTWAKSLTDPLLHTCVLEG